MTKDDFNELAEDLMTHPYREKAEVEEIEKTFEEYLPEKSDEYLRKLKRFISSILMKRAILRDADKLAKYIRKKK